MLAYKMFSTVCFFSVLVSHCTTASANTTKTCAEISNDLDRLACYDNLSGRTPKVTSIQSGSNGKWGVRSEKSQLTDRTDVFLTLSSNERINCRFNDNKKILLQIYCRDNKKILLQIYCRDNKTSLLFNTGCHMASSQYNSYGDVDFRLDNNKARVLSMTDSTDNKALGLWTGGSSIPIIKSMIGKKTLVVRMTPYGESSFTSTFDVSGLENAIKPARAACGW